MQLAAFRERLITFLGDDPAARPFVCRGDPYRCQAFVVGINPASHVPFWCFWQDASGFDWSRWREAYLASRRAQPLKPGKRFRPAESATRRVLGWIADAAAPVEILETNLYMRPTPTASELRPADRDTRAFEFLVAELRPRVILLHGGEVSTRFTKLYGAGLSTEFAPVTIAGRGVLTAAVQHLSRGVSRAKAAALGRQISNLCAALP